MSLFFIPSPSIIPETLIAPPLPQPFLPNLHLIPGGLQHHHPWCFCCCSLKGLCGGPGLTFSICSQIMDSVFFGEALSLIFALFWILVLCGHIQMQYCYTSYHNIISIIKLWCFFLEVRRTHGRRPLLMMIIKIDLNLNYLLFMVIAGN